MDKLILTFLVAIILSSGCLDLSQNEDRAYASENPNMSLEDYSNRINFVSTPFELQYTFSSNLLMEFKPQVYFLGENLVYKIGKDSPGFNTKQTTYTTTGEAANYSLKGGFSIDPLLVSNLSAESEFKGVREIAGRKCSEFSVQIRDDFNQGFAGSENKTLDTCIDHEHGYIAEVKAYSTSNITGERFNDWIYSVEKFEYGVPEELAETSRSLSKTE